jgi:hypothetical protein
MAEHWGKGNGGNRVSNGLNQNLGWQKKKRNGRRVGRPAKKKRMEEEEKHVCDCMRANREERKKTSL